MSESPHTHQQEERYPLLFLFLDDGNKGSRKGRNIFFERGRSQGIISGASNVFTQWPGYISSCGLTMIVLVLTILFLFLMIIASSIRPVGQSLRPRCIKKSFDDTTEVGLYLVHNDDSWHLHQLIILDEILTKYNQCDVELLILKSENKIVRDHKMEKNHRFIRGRHKRDVKDTITASITQLPKRRTESMNINVGAKNLLQAYLERRRHLNITSKSPALTTTTPAPSLTLDSIVKKFPWMMVINMTEREFFEASPLYGSWKNLNKLTLNFAVRVLKLWDNGGISFALPDSPKSDKISTDYYKYDISQENKTTTSSVTSRAITSSDDQMKIIDSMIDIGYTSFKNLPDGLVTVDEEGVHMETKTTCHAFFGEALNQLRHATPETTVQRVIKDTLKTFCTKGAVDSEYCNNFKLKIK